MPAPTIFFTTEPGVPENDRVIVDLFDTYVVEGEAVAAACGFVRRSEIRWFANSSL